MVNAREAQAREAIKRARIALKKDDKKVAYAWAKSAAQISPEIEDSWLILAAVSKPEMSIKFLRRALQIHPSSQRAKKGLAWAERKMSTQGKEIVEPKQAPRRVRSVQSQPPRAVQKKIPKKKKSRLPLFLAGSFLLICLVSAGFLAINTSPAKALFGSASTATAYNTPQYWAKGTIAKPTYTPSPTTTFTPTATFTPTPTFTFTPTSTYTPTATFTATITNTPSPTNTSLPTKTPKPVALATAKPPNEIGGGEHWIEVNLTQQRLYAYAGNTLVNSFVVSTGLWQTPTITGYFHVYLKYVSTTMSGPGYYLTDVPYTMYFSGDYGIHGTYWHNNFGTPMSHGCVNMRSSEAQWVYNFSPMGTLVYIHY